MPRFFFARERGRAALAFMRVS